MAQQKTARGYVRKYRWAAYFLALVICTVLGVVLWITTPPTADAVDRLGTRLAPGFLSAAIVAFLFLLSEWIKTGDDELGKQESAEADDKMRESITKLATQVEAQAAEIRVLRAELDIDGRAKDLARVGITGGYGGRIVPNEREYLQRYLNASKGVDMIGLDFSSITRNFASYSRFRPGIRVRVLMLDPDYPAAASSYVGQRTTEERQPRPRQVSGAQLFCQNFARWRNELPAEQQGALDYSIRLYQTLPAIHYVRYDDEILFGPYLIEKSSENTFTAISNSGTPIFAQLTEHFEALWTRWSRPPNDDWFDITRP
ncbi:hypothetical protein ACFVMC_12790 [Nocardia sp. NPDC127579]|uniref:hypothetical protein n=1 Tax=Nocardia sp. NPDC127579 TaxID=3345402 RepID=UPI00362E33D2